MQCPSSGTGTMAIDVSGGAPAYQQALKTTLWYQIDKVDKKQALKEKPPE